MKIIFKSTNSLVKQYQEQSAKGASSDKMLDLSANKLGKSIKDPSELQGLMKEINKSSFNTINLALNVLGFANGRNLEIILQGLKENKNLKSISLASNSLNDIPFEQLKKVIQDIITIPKLETIDLSGNNFSKLEKQQLIDLLTPLRNTSITTVIFGANQFENTYGAPEISILLLETLPECSIQFMGNSPYTRFMDEFIKARMPSALIKKGFHAAKAMDPKDGQPLVESGFGA